MYRKRQEINEHIFGTIKRQWGYSYTNLRGLNLVNGENSLIMTVYNFKRLMKILTFQDFLNKIKNWKPDYKKIRLEMLVTHYYILFLKASKYFLGESESKVRVA